MQVKIDFHCHTEASLDSRTTLDEAIAAAKKVGLSGLAVCDHNVPFLCGEQPRDFLLINGCEYSTDRGHILALFIEKAPCIFPSDYSNGKISAEKAVKEIHKAGGLAVLAHPFSGGQPNIHLPEIEGIEVWNARACFKNKQANEMAEALAKEKGLISIAGSDAHFSEEIGRGYVTFEVESLTAEALKKAFSTGEILPFSVCTKAINKGRSQFIKRKKEKKPMGIVIGLLYLGYCKMKDIFD